MYAYMDVCVYVETEEHLQRVITAPMTNGGKWASVDLQCADRGFFSRLT